MDLFKRNNAVLENNLPEVFVTIVDPEGAELPSRPWCSFEQLTAFSQLVDAREEKGVIVVVAPDTPEVMAQIRLVAENPAVCGVQIVRVDNVTDYSPSAAAQSSFWQCPLVDFVQWGFEADEAAREAELARRATLDKDERRLADNERKGGGYKRVDLGPPEVQVPDDADEAPVL